MKNQASVILLAGGKGTRMQTATPKQFLPLHGHPIAFHSLKVLLDSPLIYETVIVCDAQYRFHFDNYPVKFAEPGARRQDSVYNGLQKVAEDASWVLIHDAARPFITIDMIQNLFNEGKKIGAATLAVPMKWTVKESKQDGLVARTLSRDQIWEIQTPQLLAKEVIHKGFAHALSNNLTVTDDVSLAELIDHPVKLVQGSYQNIKITTPEDLMLAKCLKT